MRRRIRDLGAPRPCAGRPAWEGVSNHDWARGSAAARVLRSPVAWVAAREAPDSSFTGTWLGANDGRPHAAGVASPAHVAIDAGPRQRIEAPGHRSVDKWRGSPASPSHAPTAHLAHPDVRSACEAGPVDQRPLQPTCETSRPRPSRSAHPLRSHRTARITMAVRPAPMGSCDGLHKRPASPPPPPPVADHPDCPSYPDSVH